MDVMNGECPEREWEKFIALQAGIASVYGSSADAKKGLAKAGFRTSLQKLSIQRYDHRNNG
jgi:hypothetical protein